MLSEEDLVAIKKKSDRLSDCTFLYSYPTSDITLLLDQLSSILDGSRLPNAKSGEIFTFNNLEMQEKTPELEGKIQLLRGENLKLESIVEQLGETNKMLNNQLDRLEEDARFNIRVVESVARAIQQMQENAQYNKGDKAEKILLSLKNREIGFFRSTFEYICRVIFRDLLRPNEIYVESINEQEMKSASTAVIQQSFIEYQDIEPMLSEIGRSIILIMSSSFGRSIESSICKKPCISSVSKNSRDHKSYKSISSLSLGFSIINDSK